MTKAEHELAVAKERAANDLADIAFLRQNEAFNRYFVRRLNERHSKIAVAFKYDEMSPEKREQARKLVLEYEEISKMMGIDEIECEKLLKKIAPKDPNQPMFGTPGNG